MIEEMPMTRIVNFEQLQESKLPSATRFSRMIDLGGEKPNIPIYVLKKAGERGTKVHEYIHNYFELWSQPGSEVLQVFPLRLRPSFQTWSYQNNITRRKTSS